MRHFQRVTFFYEKYDSFLTLLCPQIFRAVIGPHKKSRDFSLLFSYFMKSLQHISSSETFFGYVFLSSPRFFSASISATSSNVGFFRFACFRTSSLRKTSSGTPSAIICPSQKTMTFTGSRAAGAVAAAGAVLYTTHKKLRK